MDKGDKAGKDSMIKEVKVLAGKDKAAIMVLVDRDSMVGSTVDSMAVSMEGTVDREVLMVEIPMFPTTKSVTPTMV